MNTERPDHDDAGASGEAAEEARAERPEATAEEKSGSEKDRAPEAVSEAEEAVAEEAVSDEAVPEEAVSERTVSEEAVSEAAVSETTVSEEAVSEAAVSERTVSEEAVSEGAVSEEAGDSQGASAGKEDPEEASAPAVPHAPAAPPTGAEDERDGTPDGARRRSPAVIASVAAAVLLVGGGGAYLAAGASSGSGGRTTSGASGGETPPPLHLDGASEGGGNGIAPGEPNPYGATYKADGALPDGPGSAPVYRAKGEVTQAEVARLAKALGVDGTPVDQGQTWAVGARDAAGPSLTVTKQAPGTWTFHRYAPGTDDCRSTVVCTKDPANPTVAPVSEQVARKAAAPILKAVGQDDAKIDVSQTMGAQRVVNADPVVGGLPTYGWTTGVTVGPPGEVVGAGGQLKAPVKGDTYPVLDAGKTLALMNAAQGTGDHRMGIGGCASPAPLKDRLEAPCGQSGETPRKDTVPVERAVFGLASHFVDGERALVPSWLFEVRPPGRQDGLTVTYPAVDPKYLASSTPSPAPTRPKDTPTSAPVTEDVPVDGYTADGKELTVAFTGGVCTDYKVTARESGDEVRVTVTGTSHPEDICIMIAKVFHKTVRLDEPLGDREVVGSDGKKVPLEKAADQRMPQTSGAR